MKRLILIIVCLCLMASMLGCEKSKAVLEISEEEALDVLKELVPASYEINAMFFGEGLPKSDEGEYEDTNYVPVDMEKSDHSSIISMKIAAEMVYSINYLSNVYVIMFEGTKTSESDGLLNNDVSPRYKEIANELCIDASYTPYNILGKLSVESVSISKKTQTYVIVEAKCLDEEGNEVDKRFFLTLDEGKWRLDGPTY